MRDKPSVWPQRPPGMPAPADVEPPAKRRNEELRVYGRNACLAAFARRPADVRKVYLTEARTAEFKAVLAWCAKQRVGYRVVETGDLDKLTQSQHHEGVCLDMLRRPPMALSTLLQSVQKQASSLLVWLDGVGNPHNVGAIMRSAANFGIGGLILPASSGVLSGAALRVAEGGAEVLPIAQAGVLENVVDVLHREGYVIAASVPRDGKPLFRQKLPARLVLILGAEGEGMSTQLIQRADLRLTIPGSGAVESLNVSASAAVLFAEHYRQFSAAPAT